MSDEENELPSAPSTDAASAPGQGVAAQVVPSAADAFGEGKVNAAQWVKAARSGPLRMLPQEEVLALGVRIAGDQKLLERLVALLGRFSPATSPDSATAAVLEIAKCVLRQRVPEMFDRDSSSDLEPVIGALNRLRRETTSASERHLWLEATVRTALLSKVVDSLDLPLLVRAAFGTTPKSPSGAKRKSKGAMAPSVVVDEETALLLASLGKPPVLSAILTASAIYRRKLGAVEDSLARLEVQVSQAQRERARLDLELAAGLDIVNARDEEIARLREDARKQQASWDAQRTEALHQIETLRGRMLGLLRGDLSLWLETARDAATASPPRIGVITERLERALERAAKEAEWLKSSDWT